MDLFTLTELKTIHSALCLREATLLQIADTEHTEVPPEQRFFVPQLRQVRLLKEKVASEIRVSLRTEG